MTLKNLVKVTTLSLVGVLGAAATAAPAEAAHERCYRVRYYNQYGRHVATRTECVPVRHDPYLSGWRSNRPWRDDRWDRDWRWDRRYDRRFDNDGHWNRGHHRGWYR